MITLTKSELLAKLARAEAAISAHEREIASLKATVLRQNEQAVYLERTAGVLRAANTHLRKKVDASLLQRDEARESRDAALKQRDALEGVVASLHQRAVAATEALGVVYGPDNA